MLTPLSSSASDYEHNGGSFDATDRASLVSATQGSSAASLSLDNDALSNEDDFFLADSAKLKGVFWPGMDIFDSATPEMRRKRNQKKDVSVIEQLESNSLEVEPTEVIYAPDGTQWRSRTISGMPYDDSNPFQDLSPHQQQALNSERAPLAEIDVNSTTIRGKQSNAGRQRHQGSEIVNENDNSRVRSRAATSSSGLNKRQTVPNEPARKRKRAFDVFKDEINFSNPAELSYLTAEFVNPGMVTPKTTQNQDERSRWSAGSNTSDSYLGLSRDHFSRRNPRRSCQPYQQQGGRYCSGRPDHSGKNDSHAFNSAYSSRFSRRKTRQQQHHPTGTNFHTYQCYDQAFSQAQADLQQEQRCNQQNRLFSPFKCSNNDDFLKSLQGPPHRTSDTVARLGSVLQDFPYYLSQMPYLPDTLPTFTADTSSSSNMDISRNGTGIYHTPDDLGFYSQNGLPGECRHGSFSACDLPIEEQLRLYTTTDCIDAGNERGLDGTLQQYTSSNYFDCYRPCDRVGDKAEVEAEDDQKTISAPPSER